MSLRARLRRCELAERVFWLLRESCTSLEEQLQRKISEMRSTDFRLQ